MLPKSRVDSEEVPPGSTFNIEPDVDQQPGVPNTEYTLFESSPLPVAMLVV
jgi:hypothetical protein